METTLPASLLNILNGNVSSDRETARGDSSKVLGQDEFFELMLAQMKNQDPAKPLDGQQNLAQLAQFSTVNGIQQLQSSFEKLSLSLQSMQALQASSLVGRSVLVDGNNVVLTPERPVEGSVELPDDVKDLTVVVLDAKNQEIRRIKLGDQPAGSTAFVWDGLDDRGLAATPGNYQLRTEGQVAGVTQTFHTQVRTTVESVSLGTGGQDITLNLAGLGEFALSQVKQIH